MQITENFIISVQCIKRTARNQVILSCPLAKFLNIVKNDSLLYEYHFTVMHRNHTKGDTSIGLVLQFFNEARECQQWLKQMENRLSTTYSRQNFSIDEGERLMKEMQELRDQLSHYSNLVSSLIERSKDIAPLKQRRQPLPRPLRVTSICTYKQATVSVFQLFPSVDEIIYCNLMSIFQCKKWYALVPFLC